MKIQVEIDYKGKTYKQPNCRLKIDCNGGIAILIIDKLGKWKPIKGKVKTLKILNCK